MGATDSVTAQLDEDRALVALLLTFPNLEAEHLLLLLNPPPSKWMNAELVWSFDREFTVRARIEWLSTGRWQLSLVLVHEPGQVEDSKTFKYKTKAEALVWLRDWLCTEMLMKRKCLTLYTVT